mmetsp:Transcript_31972/g.28337  ORF Transcript_31972/g.28337 Transcript_31972/m.28337 type:complete len:147 (+) Transcript_31972:11-451(+)
MSTQVEEVQITEIFALFDKNSDGLVNTNELGTILRALAHNPTKEEVKTLEIKIDPEEEGTFNVAALVGCITSMNLKSDTLEDLVEALRVLDQDQDSKLSVKELIHSLKNGGEAMEEEEIQEILNDTDLVTDGMINIDEFAKTIYNR